LHRVRNHGGALLLSTVLAILAITAILARAEKVTAPANTRLDEIVVTAKRCSDPVADEKTKQQVEEALHSDAFFYDEHVTVTTKNGVTTLQGIVFDDWDLRSAVRICRKIPGVKRVIDDLEIKLGGD
jgi:osmotically-inducible protein OsmY